MPLPPLLQGRLAIPVIAARWGEGSDPDFAIAACRNGVIGHLRAADFGSTCEFEEALSHVQLALTASDAPCSVSLSLDDADPRSASDLAICVEHRVPMLFTSRRITSELVRAVHEYGGLVFHETSQPGQSQATTSGGVDGIVLVGKDGAANALIDLFAALPELRRAVAGPIIFGECVAHGRGIAAAALLGADLVCVASPRLDQDAAEAAGELCTRLVAEYREAAPLAGGTALQMHP